MTERLDDLIVVLPGIIGSTLAKDGQLVWAPSAGAVLRTIATFGRNLEALTLPDGIGDAHPEDGVQPVALLPDLHLLPGIWSAHIGYGRLLDWLPSRFHLVEAPADDANRFANVLPFPYDWRLSNRDAQQSATYDLHPIVGFRQPTATTAQLRNGRVRALETIAGNDEGGDGTVPRLAATPARWRPNHPAIRSAAERHGSLQSNRGVLDELDFVLSARAEPYKAAGLTELAVRIDDLALAGQPIALRADTADGSHVGLLALIRDEAGREAARRLLTPGEPATLSPLPPGGYSVEIGGIGTAAYRIAPVTCPLLVWDPETAQ